ncbi:MAG: hypothetical protein H7844_13050 [Nitrospirae bacterium YQR-1]
MLKSKIVTIGNKKITINELRAKDALTLFADENNVLGKFLSGDVEATKHMLTLSGNLTIEEAVECMEAANDFVVIHRAIMEINKSFFEGYTLMIQRMIAMTKSLTGS